MPSPDALRHELETAVREAGLATGFLMLTDILEERSLLLAADAAGETLAARAFGRPFVDGRLLLPGVMSRKKQVMPPIAAALTAG